MTVTYKIGEAAALLNLKTYVLRFWETEFPQITPLRTEKGQRLYTEDHLALLDRIRFLLHNRGLTIEGARKVLTEEAGRGIRYIRAGAEPKTAPTPEASLDAAAAGNTPEPLFIPSSAAAPTKNTQEPPMASPPSPATMTPTESGSAPAEAGGLQTAAAPVSAPIPGYTHSSALPVMDVPAPGGPDGAYVPQGTMPDDAKPAAGPSSARSMPLPPLHPATAQPSQAAPQAGAQAKMPTASPIIPQAGVQPKAPTTAQPKIQAPVPAAPQAEAQAKTPITAKIGTQVNFSRAGAEQPTPPKRSLQTKVAVRFAEPVAAVPPAAKQASAAPSPEKHTLAEVIPVVTPPGNAPVAAPPTEAFSAETVAAAEIPAPYRPPRAPENLPLLSGRPDPAVLPPSAFPYPNAGGFSGQAILSSSEDLPIAEDDDIFDDVEAPRGPAERYLSRQTTAVPASGQRDTAAVTASAAEREFLQSITDELEAVASLLRTPLSENTP